MSNSLLGLLDEQEKAIQALRLCLHRICRMGAQTIADCENEGADRSASYLALCRLADEARRALGLPIKSGE